MKKILAIRTDRLGDSILTLPAIQLLKKYYPEDEIYFMVKKENAEIFKNNPHISGIIELNENDKVLDIVRKIKKYSFDISINFFVDKITPLAVFLAKIPIRIGPFSKIHSLFLNKRIKQSRKKSIKHEADYNIELLKLLDIPYEKQYPRIYLQEEEKKNFRFSGKAEIKNGEYVIIHPGGAKRGKSLPKEKFLEIAEFLDEKKINFFISIGPEDKKLKELFKHFKIIENLKIREFAVFISMSKLFISNSTGPLHLAVALGIPTISFYGKEKTISPIRWGPYSDKNLHRVFTTKHDFSDLTMEEVYQELEKLLSL